VLAQRQRAVIVPIIGARRSSQIDNGIGAVDIELSSDELELPEALADPRLCHSEPLSGTTELATLREGEESRSSGSSIASHIDRQRYSLRGRSHAQPILPPRSPASGTSQEAKWDFARMTREQGQRVGWTVVQP
jgi:hypothetical protein